MFRRLAILGWIGVLLDQSSGPAAVIRPAESSTSPTVHRPLLVVPTDSVANNYRDRVAKVTRQPTIVARAAPEEFSEGIYDWLLNHPDRGSLAWRRLGIPCAEITDRGQGRFGWSDGQGTEVTWLTVAKTDTCRVWYAEGQTRLSTLMAAVPVKAVVVLQYSKSPGRDKRMQVTQVCDIYLQTDSAAAAVTARVIGPAAPRLAQTGAEQLLLFFSGLTRYFEDHPEDIASLLAPKQTGRTATNP